jgi:pyrimidine deaminase RibD-like protein
MTSDLDCMEKAVAEARHSRQEPGRISPKVGDVVLKDGVILGEAHRGEDPNGKDHAEYYLLETKLRTKTLSGSTVFTTLEPCYERGAGKTPCAKRLVARQVDRVIIGMLDPDPTVHGKGQMYLLEHGIKVGTFDPPLTKEILEMNRDFIEDRQAPRFRITPLGDRPFKAGTLKIEGTYRIDPSPGERFALFTRKGKQYWPQGRFRMLENGKWDCEIDEGYPGETDIIIAQIDPGIDLWVQHYLKVGKDHKKWVGLDIEQPPAGFRPNDVVTIKIEKAEGEA